MIKDLDVIFSVGDSYTVEFNESADKSLPSKVGISDVIENGI